MQMFPSLAAWETLLRMQKKFLNQVKNIFASRMQILLAKQMFPSLATQETWTLVPSAARGRCSLAMQW